MYSQSKSIKMSSLYRYYQFQFAWKRISLLIYNNDICFISTKDDIHLFNSVTIDKMHYCVTFKYIIISHRIL